MTLTETLQIKARYLQLEDMRAIDYCEKRWQSEGCPVERWGMVNFIEKMLKELPANGIAYPAVLLLRKKEIQRKQFSIERTKPETATAKCACSNGWLSNGKPCTCEKGRPHVEQLRKWGMNV